MQKIISLFQRNYDGDRKVRNEVTPGAEWVLAGEGIATRKFDGTCCMVRDGKLYARYDAKRGKTPPPDFEPAQPDPDPLTGHWPGWVLVTREPSFQWHRLAWKNDSPLPDGTYELCGPNVQGNPEGYSILHLIRHGSRVLEDCPRDFDGIRNYLQSNIIEGIVWHHDDGRMVKIKTKDFAREEK
jgi:Family of unknown function (DUF5565)